MEKLGVILLSVKGQIYEMKTTVLHYDKKYV